MHWYLIFILNYGYAAILLGTLVEGEICLALGGVFARQGYMSLWMVIAMALLGSFIMHGLFYFLGRWRGKAVIGRFSKLQAGYPRAQALAERFGPACILIVQFLCGMRLVTCLALGSLRLKTVTFIFWQLLAISIWATTLAVAGYTFGATIQYLVSRAELFLTVAAGVIIILISAYRWFWLWTEHQIDQVGVLEAALAPSQDSQILPPSIRRRHPATKIEPSSWKNSSLP
jgi:membrane protein DedA with SNARE-associated domain